MHKYYAFNEAIKGNMQRVKKGEKIMYSNEDLACDGRMTPNPEKVNIGEILFDEEVKVKAHIEGHRFYDRVTTVDKDDNVISDVYHDEVRELIDSRSNGTYNEIAEDAGDIMAILGDDIRFAYFFSQIANKLARMKHRYSVEDSLLDIAGYATLELERLRSEQ